MTEQERINIVQEVLAAVNANSKTIEQLTLATSVGDNDSIELSGGKRVRYSVLSEQIRALNDGAMEALTAEVATVKNFVANIALVDIDLHRLNATELELMARTKQPMAYRVLDGTTNVGLLIVTSDGMRHQLTEVFVTDCRVQVSGEMGKSHDDRMTFVYRRNLGDLSNPFTSTPRPSWSAWERIDGAVEQWATNQRFCKGALVAHNGVLYKVAANVATTEPSAMNPDYTALVADATTLVAQERAERIWAVNQLASNASAARAQMENRLAALIRQEEADRLEADAQMENRLTALIRQEEADRLEADAQIVARVETAQATAEQMLPKSSIVVLTEDEYDALLVKNPDTYYLITEDD